MTSEKEAEAVHHHLLEWLSSINYQLADRLPLESSAYTKTKWWVNLLSPTLEYVVSWWEFSTQCTAQTGVNNLLCIELLTLIIFLLRFLMKDVVCFCLLIENCF
jgi:hypothetical protein